MCRKGLLRGGRREEGAGGGGGRGAGAWSMLGSRLRFQSSCVDNKA